MKQLDPRAIRLFFLTSSILTIIFGGTSLLVLIPLLLTIETGAVLIVLLFCVVLLGLLGFSYFWATLTYNNFKYELSEDAFKKEQGIIFKKYVSIPYERVQNVDIYRGLLSRMLGLSDLQIQTAGLSFTGQYGASSEGRLPGLSKEVAEELRDEIIRRSKANKQ